MYYDVINYTKQKSIVGRYRPMVTAAIKDVDQVLESIFNVLLKVDINNNYYVVHVIYNKTTLFVAFTIMEMHNNNGV